MNTDKIIEQQYAYDFMLAGKAEFIMHSTKTNDDFHYKITKRDDKNNENEFIYFINIDKEYAGVMRYDHNAQNFVYKQGQKGNIPITDIRVRSIIFVLNKLIRKEPVMNLTIIHIGKCGHCGKKLTDPESILTGLGPTCSKKLGIPRIKL